MPGNLVLAIHCALSSYMPKLRAILQHASTARLGQVPALMCSCSVHVQQCASIQHASTALLSEMALGDVCAPSCSKLPQPAACYTQPGWVKVLVMLSERVHVQQRLSWSKEALPGPIVTLGGHSPLVCQFLANRRLLTGNMPFLLANKAAWKEC